MSDFSFWDAKKKNVLKYDSCEHSNLYGIKRVVLIEKMNVTAVNEEKRRLLQKKISSTVDRISEEIKSKGRTSSNLANFVVVSPGIANEIDSYIQRVQNPSELDEDNLDEQIED
jgi:hypothetical protein